MSKGPTGVENVAGMPNRRKNFDTLARNDHSFHTARTIGH